MTVNKSTENMLKNYVLFIGDEMVLKDNAPPWARELFEDLKNNLSILYGQKGN